MTRARFAALLALLFVAVLCASPAAAQETKNPKKVEKAEDEVTTAYNRLRIAETTKKDRAVMQELMADDYLYIHSNGALATKAQDIASDMAADQQWTASRADSLKVRVYGHVAVVTGIETLTGTAKGFVPGPRRFSEVWVRTDKAWQCVSGQATLVPAK